MKSFLSKKNLIIVGIVIAVLLIIGFIVYSNAKIPSEYYGVYTRYSYVDGKESKTTYTIKPLSIEMHYEYDENGNLISEDKKIDFYKKDNDLIIKNNDYEQYVILDDGHLYINPNKDIELSKKYKIYYWNEKGNNSTEEELFNKVDIIESKIEDLVNDWARKEISDDTYKYSFYILDSDDEPDKSDLNVFTVKKKASNGDLSFTFDKKTKKLKNVFFSGSVFTSAYNGRYDDTMSAEDINDVESMILALMYMYQNTDEKDSYKDPEAGLKAAAKLKYYTMMLSSEKDSSYDNGYKYEFDNTDYNVSFKKLLNTSKYLASGFIYLDFEIKNN